VSRWRVVMENRGFHAADYFCAPRLTPRCRHALPCPKPSVQCTGVWVCALSRAQPALLPGPDNGSSATVAAAPSLRRPPPLLPLLPVECSDIVGC